MSAASGGATQEVVVRLRLEGSPQNASVTGDIQKQLDSLRKATERGFQIGGIGGNIKGEMDRAMRGAVASVQSNGARIKAASADFSKAMIEGMTAAGNKRAMEDAKASQQIIAGMSEQTRAAKAELDKQVADAKAANDKRIADATQANAQMAANMTKLMSGRSADLGNLNASHTMIAGMSSGAQQAKEAAARASSQVMSEFGGNWNKFAQMSSVREGQDESKRIADRIKEGKKAEADAKKQADEEAKAAKKAAKEKIDADNDVVKNRAKMLGQIATFEKQKETLGRRAELASMRQQMIVARSEQSVVDIGTQAGSVARSMMMLSAGNEPLEKMAQSIIKIQATFDIFRSGAEIFVQINRELLNMRRYAYYATIEQRALGLATAATPRLGAGGAIAAGAATTGGTGAAAGTAGAAIGLGQMASMGGMVAGLLRRGVLLHDGFVTVINSTGLFHTKLDTLTGTLSGWNNAVEENTRLEERYKIQLEGRQASIDEQARIADQQRKFREGRTRLEEAREGGWTAATSRTSGHALGGVLHGISHRFAIPAGPLSSQQMRDFHARLDREERDTERARRLSEKEDERTRSSHGYQRIAEQEKAVRAAEREAKRKFNTIIMPGVAFGNLTQTQKNIDELEEKHDVGGPGWWGRILRATTAARAAPTGAPFAMTQPAAKNLSGLRDEQQKLLNIQKEQFGVATQLAQQYKNQVVTLNEQVHAAQRNLLSAKQQVQSAKENLNSNLAGFSELPKGMQVRLAEILHKVNAGGKLSREEALLGKKHGLGGRFGKAFDERVAQDVDPNLRKELEKGEGGGFKELHDATAALSEAQQKYSDKLKDGDEVLSDFYSALDDIVELSTRITTTQKGVEHTSAEAGGYTDPNGKGGNSPTAVAGRLADNVKQEGQGAIAAVEHLGTETVNQIRGLKAEIERNAHRIKGA